MRNRQCSYKQDATSHTKSCTCIYSVVIPIQLNREMASVYSSFSHFSLTTNLKYTYVFQVGNAHTNKIPLHSCTPIYSVVIPEQGNGFCIFKLFLFLTVKYSALLIVFANSWHTKKYTILVISMPTICKNNNDAWRLYDVV